MWIKITKTYYIHLYFQSFQTRRKILNQYSSSGVYLRISGKKQLPMNINAYNIWHTPYYAGQQRTRKSIGTWGEREVISVLETNSNRVWNLYKYITYIDPQYITSNNLYFLKLYSVPFSYQDCFSLVYLIKIFIEIKG